MEVAPSNKMALNAQSVRVEANVPEGSFLTSQRAYPRAVRRAIAALQDAFGNEGYEIEAIKLRRR